MRERHGLVKIGSEPVSHGTRRSYLHRHRTELSKFDNSALATTPSDGLSNFDNPFPKLPYHAGMPPKPPGLGVTKSSDMDKIRQQPDIRCDSDLF